MKYITLLLILLSACHVKKENTPNTDINRLHDIWALSSIGKEIYTPKEGERHPLLEIFVAEKRFNGNDGCNSVFGSIKTLTLTQLEFGPMAGTKMMCEGMEVPDAYTKGIAETKTYTLEELKLYLYDERGKELLVFKKVD